MKYLILVLLVAITSCSKGPTSPEGLLRMFVSDVSTKKVGKDYYDKYTTGKLKELIEAMSDEEFTKYTNMVGVKSAKVKVLNKNCQSDNECTVTYLVKYETHSEGKKSFDSEVKKLAELKKEGENWKVSEVTNIKTFHQAHSPIDVSDK